MNVSTNLIFCLPLLLDEKLCMCFHLDRFVTSLQIGRSYVISKLKKYPKFQAVAIAIQRSGFKVDSISIWACMYLWTCLFKSQNLSKTLLVLNGYSCAICQGNDKLHFLYSHLVYWELNSSRFGTTAQGTIMKIFMTSILDNWPNGNRFLFLARFLSRYKH